MILWTIHPAEIYNQIINNGYYHFDDKILENKAWRNECPEAYAWLVSEMTKRIGPPPKGITSPVWAWYIHASRRKKPDLRKSEYGRKGESMVCLEIDIPDNAVVLSDEEAWHFVMNNQYLSNATCEETYNMDISQFEELPEYKKHEAIISSWQNIFDIESFDNGFKATGRFVQATFWELKAEQIRKVQYFTAR